MRKSVPHFSISKSKRADPSLFQVTPGSGSYFAVDHLSKTHAASWRIGSEKRPGQQQYVPQTPGPGQYNKESTLAGPRFYIGQKIQAN
jgi:hypothetical protein